MYICKQFDCCFYRGSTAFYPDFFATTGLHVQNMQKDTTRPTNPFSCMRKITLSRSLLSNISKALFTTVYRFRYWHTSFVCLQDALHVSSTHRLHMHGNTLTLLCIPRTIRDFHAHLYVPWAIRDLLASIVLPKGRIDYIRPLGRIGFACIYTSLGPYKICMHLYVPRELQQANMAWYFLQI